MQTVEQFETRMSELNRLAEWLRKLPAIDKPEIIQYLLARTSQLVEEGCE